MPSPGMRTRRSTLKDRWVPSAEGRPVGDADELHQLVPGPRLPLQTRGRPPVGF